jgi:hypothetical protein
VFGISLPPRRQRVLPQHGGQLRHVWQGMLQLFQITVFSQSTCPRVEIPKKQ